MKKDTISDKRPKGLPLKKNKKKNMKFASCDKNNSHIVHSRFVVNYNGRSIQNT